jgi:hypothetical protein
MLPDSNENSNQLTDTAAPQPRRLEIDPDDQPTTSTEGEELVKQFAAGSGPEKPPAMKPKKALPVAVRILLGLLVFLLVIAGGLALIGFKAYQVALQLQTQGEEAKVLASASYTAFKEQNLPEAETKLKETRSKVDAMEQTYQTLSSYKNMPGIGGYYQDGEHVLNAALSGLAGAEKALAAITPYADVLGFQGEGTFAGGTAEDRIKILIETLDMVMPVFDEIIADFETAEQELAQINPNRYPESINGQVVRSRLVEVQSMAKSTISTLEEFRPVLEQLPDIAGGKGERKKYLVLFQNDNELRPTGGFLTAYAVIYIENGKVTPEKSDDIYELDKKFTKKIPIPEKLGKYLTTEKYFNMRDMNTSPDFKTSMDLFYSHYSAIKSEPDNIDGIITVDTHVLTQLVSILGPVEIPGYGTFSAEIDKRCDCPQIVYALSEIITRPTPYMRVDRKGILGPMMQAILTKTYSAGKQAWPKLFETAWVSLQGRHLQMYFMDEKAQQAAEAVNGAGRMLPPTDGEDFLAIVNANLGGAKSNLFITYDVKQTVSTPENGKLTKTVEITYKNSRKGDNCNLEAGLLCLNSRLYDWTRLYLPAGAELIEAQGFNKEPGTYEEAGFTVVDGFFNLEPMSSAKLVVKYSVPYTDTKTYRVKLWKQGGVSPFTTLFDVAGGEDEVLVNTDTLFTTQF